MIEKKVIFRPRYWFVVWTAIAVGLRLAVQYLPVSPTMASGTPALVILSYVAALLALSNLFSAITLWWFLRSNRPASEGMMVGRLYHLCATIGAVLVAAYGLGKLQAFGSAFAMFGGMLLGWSLQAPVSGFAAWILVSLKRPFRPGDRIQFPSLNLVGDVKEIGAMYTILDQVGGTIGSEEAVGRYILVPNAMLFNQVVINYTVQQDAAYMLDEIVIRITYDSNWDSAEKILIDAAVVETKEIIEASGVKPYVRSDWYDYGVYLRLRYQTRVQDRVDISYRIQKKIFEEVQRTPTVDMAIPYVYSYRASLDKKEEDLPPEERSRNIQAIPVDQIADPETPPATPREIEALAKGIAREGLLQPVVLAPKVDGKGYEILAGHLRFAACKSLGWKTIPAVLRHRHDGEIKPTA